MIEALLLLVACVLPSGQDTQWRITFEIKTETHVIQRWSTIEDRGQTLRDVLDWPHTKEMESRGYTLIGIERVQAVRKVLRLPTEAEHDAVRKATEAEHGRQPIPCREYETWLEEHRKSQDGPFIGNGG